MKPFALTTPRLRLERLGRAHIDDLVDLDSDPEVVRYVGGVSPTRAQYESEILARIVAYDDEPFGFLAAFEEGRFIGDEQHTSIAEKTRALRIVFDPFLTPGSASTRLREIGSTTLRRSSTSSGLMRDP